MRIWAFAAGLKGGLAAIASKFKKLALELGHSHEHEASNSSSVDGASISTYGASTSFTMDGEAQVSISPVPTPKDGTSVLRALAYKQHHGYLPSPTASSAGAMRKSFSEKLASGSGLSRAGSESVSRAASTKLLDIPSTGLEGIPDACTGPVTAPASSMLSAAGAPGDGASAPTGTHGSLLPLPPGAVPMFGPAAAAAAAKATPADAGNITASSLLSSAAMSGSVGGISSAGNQPQQRSVPDSSPVAGQPKLTGPYKLGPASLPGPMLLAVSPWLPRAMQRDYWCLADFVVQKKLYDGYASTICRVRPMITLVTCSICLLLLLGLS